MYLPNENYARSHLLGRYIDLFSICTCTQTFKRFEETIQPFPQNPESLIALGKLGSEILDPVIGEFGLDRFVLTYGFCSKSLKRHLLQKGVDGKPNGRVAPDKDQHMSCEINTLGNYYCPRLGAACDFKIAGLDSEALVDWILEASLPFDSLYYYGPDRPIHISYGPQHKRDIWAFLSNGRQPTRKGIERWLAATRTIPSFQELGE